MNAPLLPGRIEHWPLARLRPYARNAKTHDADQVAKIAASMAEFGWTVPCLVAADSELIAGHGRVLAATQLGLAEAPVIVLGHLTEAQRRAYRIADNKLTELGGWDEALLLEELRGLMAEDFDLGLIGITEDELDALLHDADDRTPIDDDTADTIPEAPAEPITRPGDIWRLGHHRLVCGDATDPAVVARLMDGALASLLFTSPPYAQQRDYGAAKEKVGDWDSLMQGVFGAAPVTADAQLLVNLGLVHRDGEWIPYWEGWIDWMRAQGWRRFGWYVWDQGPGLPGDWNGRLAPSHEFIFHFNRQPRKPNKTVESKHAGETLGGGGLRGADGTVHRKTGSGNAIQSHRIPDSVFRIMRHKGGLGAAGSHPAVFPVSLVETVLEAFTDPGDLVFEPFCGSGTQLIAAERTGRRSCAVGDGDGEKSCNGNPLAGRGCAPYYRVCRSYWNSKMPNLICNVVWMPHYRGEADVHPGGFDYVSINGYGHELLNFDPLNGKVFGYVQTRNATVNITRLGAKPDDDFLDGVRIIFISTHETHGPVVIGWYENARVWRRKQPGLRSIPTHPEIKIDYQFEASADNATLLPVSQRLLAVPNRKKGFPGQSPVFFPDESDEMRTWMRKFEKYFEEKMPGRVTAPKKAKDSGRSNDAEHNALVEVSAIEAVIALLGPLHRDRQPDNCGWDLEFERSGKRLCVEVKGNSGLTPRAEVSPNEYRTILEVMEGRFTDGEYRLAIVTDAFGGRKVHLFGFTVDKGWVCERTGASINATERVAAIFN